MGCLLHIAMGHCLNIAMVTVYTLQWVTRRGLPPKHHRGYYLHTAMGCIVMAAYLYEGLVQRGI